MPQASTDLQDWAIQRFGSLNSGEVVGWLLESSRWTHRVGGILIYNGAWKDVPVDERKAACFLAEEWDYDYGPASAFK